MPPRALSEVRADAEIPAVDPPPTSQSHTLNAAEHPGPVRARDPRSWTPLSRPTGCANVAKGNAARCRSGSALMPDSRAEEHVGHRKRGVPVIALPVPAPAWMFTATGIRLPRSPGIPARRPRRGARAGAVRLQLETPAVSESAVRPSVARAPYAVNSQVAVGEPTSPSMVTPVPPGLFESASRSTGPPLGSLRAPSQAAP
jgi:hypothetical protein